MAAVNYTAAVGTKLLGSELGAWLTETTPGDVTGVGVSSDLSATGIDLDATGTMTKSAVATGAALMAYSGFSATDYMTRAYGADLDLTANVTIMGWVKTSSALNQAVCGNYAAAGDPGGYLLYISAGSVWMLARPDTGASKIAKSTALVNDNQWHFVVGTVDTSGNVKVYVDGMLGGAVSGANMGNTATLFHVGAYAGGAEYFRGSLSIIKVLGSVLTAAQIKTIYQSEKDLFKKYAPYTQVGENYSLDFSISVLDRSEKVISNEAVSLGGGQETTFQRRDVFHDITINQRTSSNLPELRSFLNSVESGQSFSFDRYGSVATPDDMVTVVAKPGFKESRQGVSDLFAVSIKIREI